MKKTQLQFRVWHNNKEIYIPLASIHFEPNRIVVYDGCQHYELDHDVMLELYSNHNDRNNKDIYEGDILKDTLGDIYIVVYWNNGFWLEPITRNTSLKKMSYTVHCDVIGNVRKNQDLVMKEL